MRNLKAFCDGGQDSASRRMLAGFWIMDQDGTYLYDSSTVEEVGTTNQAEYTSMICLLSVLYKMASPGDAITIYGDSQILIFNLQNKYKIKHPNLVDLSFCCKSLICGLRLRDITLEFVWRRRGGNKAADYLAGLPVKKDGDKILKKLSELKAKDLAYDQAKDDDGKAISRGKGKERIRTKKADAGGSNRVRKASKNKASRSKV